MDLVEQSTTKVETAESVDKPHAIGIDLGTTNSCVAVLRHGKVEVIANEQGYYVTPSYVAFNDLERLIGDAAKKQAHNNTTNTIFDAKRLIGRKFNDPTVQDDMKNWPFTVIDGAAGPNFQIMYKNEQINFAPEQIGSMILYKMKEIAEKYLNEKVTNVVITVPAYFNHTQRSATYDAARIAGLNVLKLLNEPTAAAIAYGFNNFQCLVPNANIMVVDLGGGTFDVSILHVDDNQVVVKASCGDTHLGGEDFDCRLLQYCIQDFRRKHKKDIGENMRAMRRLRTACEIAKRELSTAIETEISLDSFHEGMDLIINITRARFEELNATDFKRILIPMQTALTEAKLRKDEINNVILVGGSTRIPKIRKIVQEFFDGKEMEQSIDPDHAVAYGAAIHAAISNKDISQKIFGHILKDITPLSLGFGTDEHFERMCVLIPRNSLLPAEGKIVCTNKTDNQLSMMFPIHQGESLLAKENHLLGSFVLDGLVKGPKQSVKADIKFEIDLNGILHVSAKDRVTGNSNGIQIKDVCGNLKAEQIDKMIADAEKYRLEEEQRKTSMRIKNNLEDECYSIIDRVNDGADQLNETDKAEIMDKCNEIIGWIEKNPRENLNAYENRKKEVDVLTKKLFKKVKLTK